MEITFFSIPKAFKRHWAIAQNNAIKSWMCLNPDKIILFGRDGWEPAHRLGCTYRYVRLHKRFEVPFVSDAFYRAQEEATTRLVCYNDSDVILMDDFAYAVARVSAHFDGDFLMTGNRYSLSIKEPLDFSGDWQKRLREQSKRSRPQPGVDYLVFTRGLYRQMPEFLVGRTEWDSWAPYHIMLRKIPVVDATMAVRSIHQDPPRKQLTDKKPEEVKYNKQLSGGLRRRGQPRKAAWMLTENFELVER